LESGFPETTFQETNMAQIWQNLHTNNDLTSDYTLVWFFLVNWHHNSHGVAPK
jgi:hypothetical protein